MKKSGKIDWRSVKQLKERQHNVSPGKSRCRGGGSSVDPDEGERRQTRL